ncbi:glutathione transferase fosA [Fictibacillus macauensis ZFHKF-1]|uniref:Glutathione transferase fosA n=1 Tax=Fictibacillus macauensis ZFHKF-1 TaxID=1196324 RepID=I8J2N0_9BACL|nr:glutathione transferase fosA [Fictibacillus macauensis ZFHKF-1]
MTLTVSDLSRSVAFYVDVLGAKLIHQGNTDVYLEWGSVWLCLLQKANTAPLPKRSVGLDHLAFTVTEDGFHKAVTILKAKNVPIVREPVERGGGRSINFLDPDGIQLELHTGSLAKRMSVWK